MACESIRELHKYATQTGLRGAMSEIVVGEDIEMHKKARVQQEILDIAEAIICNHCPINTQCNIKAARDGDSFFTRRKFNLPHGNETRR